MNFVFTHKSRQDIILRYTSSVSFYSLNFDDYNEFIILFEF